MYVCMYLSIYLSTYVCMYVCMYVYIYILMYVYIYILYVYALPGSTFNVFSMAVAVFYDRFWFLILNYYFLMYCVAFDEMGFYHIYISIYTRTFCVTILSWDLM